MRKFIVFLIIVFSILSCASTSYNIDVEGQELILNEIEETFYLTKGISEGKEYRERKENFLYQIESVMQLINDCSEEFDLNPNNIERNKQIVMSLNKAVEMNQIKTVFNNIVNRIFKSSGHAYFDSQKEMLYSFHNKYQQFGYNLDSIDVLSAKAENLKNNIYLYSCNFEQNHFVDLVSKSYNRELYINKNARVFNSLSYAIASDDIKENRLYYLDSSFENYQNAENGELIIKVFKGNNYIYYLESNQKHVNGYKFSERDYVFIDGLFDYDSLGSIKTVYKLKYIRLNRDYYFINE